MSWRTLSTDESVSAWKGLPLLYPATWNHATPSGHEADIAAGPLSAVLALSPQLGGDEGGGITGGSEGDGGEDISHTQLGPDALPGAPKRRRPVHMHSVPAVHVAESAVHVLPTVSCRRFNSFLAARRS